MMGLIIFRTIIWMFNNPVLNRMDLCSGILFIQFKKRLMKMMEVAKAISNDKYNDLTGKYYNNFKY
jgi:hypothetical protein